MGIAFRTLPVAAGVLAAALVGCTKSTSGAGDVERAASPLVGAWTINGDVPSPKPDLPQFTALTFGADGTLQASYVVAGGALSGVLQKSPTVKHESDSYSLVGSKALRIVEGSRALAYTYDVRDGKLFLTPQAGGATIVYAKT